MKKLICVFLCLLCTPGLCAVFSTTGHKKSNGLNIELHYPDGWTASEGIRPHIVQKFTKGTGSYCMLQIQATGQELSNAEWSEAFKYSTESEWKEMFSGLDQQRKMISMKHTKYEGLDGVMFETEMVAERGGMTIYSRGIMHMFGYKDSWISVECVAGGLTKQDAQQKFNQELLDFIRFGNGLVLLDKYM